MQKKKKKKSQLSTAWEGAVLQGTEGGVKISICDE